MIELTPFKLTVKQFRLHLLIILMITALSGGVSGQYQLENLNRGMVAIKNNGTGIFISWRLLASDPDSISFNVYRGTTRINPQPLVNSTNYVDNSGTISDTYHVKPVLGGVEQAVSETVQPWAQNYLSVPLQIPSGGTTPDAVAYTYNANDCSTGDLDGDGEYDIVLKWDPSNSKDNSQSGYTGNVFLDAYKMNGTRLWRIDLGINIRAGAHYTQFMVYDLDGDGKAEIACKTAPGTKDASGNFISLGPAASANHAADYRNSSGYILSGPEYFTLFSGETGLELATADYIPPRGDLASWGDTYGNRVDRFLACIAYLDGTRPSVVMCRGYYTGSGRGRTVMAAWDYRDNTLTNRWTFSADLTGAYSTYTGQGNHNLSVGDVDDDSKDEIIYGSCAVDDNGAGLWTTGLGHGDAMHLSDIDPDRPGLEVWGIHEGDDTPGSALLDARTGEVIWKTTNADVGRGVAADLIALQPGLECWGGTDGLRTAKNTRAGNAPASSNHVIWWDKDLTRELLNNTSIDKFGSSNLLTADGCSSNNGTKSNPALQADILGDWREEVVFRTSNNDALRIYTTIIPTIYRLPTLMHDHVYRLGVAWQNVAYNQPPHTGFYLYPALLLHSPSGLYTRNDFRKVKLFWDADITGAIAGYNVYRSQTSGSGYSKINSTLVTGTSYLNSSLTDNTNYYYVVTAVDYEGGESGYSAEVAATPGPVSILQENEGILSGGSIGNNNIGFHGTGFYNFGTNSSYADFINIGGHLGDNYKIIYRYALGTTDRTGSLSINGILQNLTMKNTTAWTTYVYDSVVVVLTAGFTNTLRFATTGSGLGSLDEIIIKPAFMSGVDDRNATLQTLFKGIFPNPFNDHTRIEYKINESCSVKIEILNIIGQTIRTLTDVTLVPGEYDIVWDGCNNSGNKVSAGIYYCRLTIDNHNYYVQKIIVAGKY
jgi:rhamnogalacturonan endolyase